MLKIPKFLARNHGGAKAGAIGAKWAETFVLHGGLSSTCSVLDIGCGPGRMALAIGERFSFATPHYLGFDITRDDIAWSAANISSEHPHFSFIHIDARNAHYNPTGRIDPINVRFPAEDAAFDFAFATSVFTHMRTPELLRYLSETRRCLKPGGRLFATFFGIEGRPERARFNFSLKLDEESWTARPDLPEEVIGYRTHFILESLRASGFHDAAWYRGEWSGVHSGRHSQDYVVAT